jgi:hypothetical protein
MLIKMRVHFHRNSGKAKHSHVKKIIYWSKKFTLLVASHIALID